MSSVVFGEGNRHGETNCNSVGGFDAARRRRQTVLKYSILRSSMEFGCRWRERGGTVVRHPGNSLGPEEFGQACPDATLAPRVRPSMSDNILNRLRESYPASGERPQAIINREIVDAGDILVGITSFMPLQYSR